MRPGTGIGDIKMIAAGLRLEPALTGRARAAVRRDPVAKGGLRANETPAGLCGIVRLAVPDAVNDNTHS